MEESNQEKCSVKSTNLERTRYYHNLNIFLSYVQHSAVLQQIILLDGENAVMIMGRLVCETSDLRENHSQHVCFSLHLNLTYQDETSPADIHSPFK